MSKPKLFSMVKCRAYLRQVHDGVCIILLSRKEVEELYGVSELKKHPLGMARAMIPEGEKDLSDFEGEGVEKTYRIRTEKEFRGCVVGYDKVDVKGIIGTDTAEYYREDGYEEKGYVFKKITEQPEVAIVYYGNNRKRYVLLEDIEEDLNERRTL